jgi:hypothetical protein
LISMVAERAVRRAWTIDHLLDAGAWGVLQVTGHGQEANTTVRWASMASRRWCLQVALVMRNGCQMRRALALGLAKAPG